MNIPVTIKCQHWLWTTVNRNHRINQPCLPKNLSDSIWLFIITCVIQYKSIHKTLLSISYTLGVQLSVTRSIECRSSVQPYQITPVVILITHTPHFQANQFYNIASNAKSHSSYLFFIIHFSFRKHAIVLIMRHAELLTGKTNTAPKKEFWLDPINKIVTLGFP